LGEKEALPGEVAFRLYDTFGFPLDLTQDVLRGQGRTVDTKGFDAAMQKQREDARKAWAGSGEAADESIWFDIREELGATEFLGYTSEFAEGQVLAIVEDGTRVEQAQAGSDVALIVNQTPFYAESGGQMGDTGTFSVDGSVLLTVTDTQKKVGDLHVHFGAVSGGPLLVNDVVEMSVDGARRAGLRGNHSATHLLHAALRERLGDHVTQKGSLVAPDRLRFDISHPKAIDTAELVTVADDVNQQIMGNGEVVTRLMTPDEAIETGAMALFGEKYGEEVRVVSMGEGENIPYSVELCGGTHVNQTGEIGPFHIVSESAVGAGVRRIEAVTGPAALAQMAETEAQLQEVAALLNVSPGQVSDRIKSILDERKKLETDLSEARRKLATGGGTNDSDDGVKEIAGIKFAGRVLERVPAKELKSFADDLKKQIGTGVVAICGTDDGKASLVVGVTEDITDRFDAVALVRVGSSALGGKGGGGRPDMAQAGGPDAAQAGQAIAAIEDTLSE